MEDKTTESSDHETGKHLFYFLFIASGQERISTIVVINTNIVLIVIVIILIL